MRRLLTPQEIIELDQALIEVFALHRELKSRILTAHHIKFPQIPAILAESFVIVTANKLFGADWKAIFGGSVSDIQLLNATGQTRRVEVKSTAIHEFQELKSKDLLADTLVWVRFGKRFHEGYGTIQIVILESPGNHILEPVRLDIPRLMRRIGDTSGLRHIEITDLEEFLFSPYVSATILSLMNPMNHASCPHFLALCLLVRVSSQLTLVLKLPDCSIFGQCSIEVS